MFSLIARRGFVLLPILFCLGFPAMAAAGEYNEVLNIGDAAPAWKELPGVDGKQHALADLQKFPAVLVLFTCNSCPVAQDYEDRLIALANRHAEKLAVVAINVNRTPADSLANMKARAEERKFPFAYLFDESQQIAKQYGAVFTPECFLLNAQRRVVYMGGIDNNSQPDQASEHYLADAILALLDGKEIKPAEMPARGCRIRFVRKRGGE
jgi:peroxiredoxin